MGKINVLDKHISELIAAGEVVERPSSVVKELIENSIDANATAIEIEIKNGGTSYIKISDNGQGILREDVPKAFLRHATSKVKNHDDLDSIKTLGFRGEALASIAAVSKVEMITKSENELAGTCYKIEGSDEVSIEDIGCPTGTTIIIKDLFYNTPARMKFLKKDASEASSVSAIVDRIALSHPDISFKFIKNSKEELNTPGDGNIKSCIYSVYGKSFSAGLIPVKYELNSVKVYGFTCDTNSARPNRSMQHFFINGRYVKSKTMMVALEQAYKGSIMVGKFPSCVLYLELSYEVIDVNVHPAKIEEMVEKAKEEVSEIIKSEGERASLETGINNLHPDIIKLLGKLKYRTSYGQNVLNHSIEVSNLARIMAEELGLDAKLARRAGLLHDIGKALDHDMEGTHVEIGVDVLKKYKENDLVINAVQAHHGDVEPKTIEAVLIQAADAISASRPGARRETLEAYIKRLEKLEEIADSFEGVEKSFAIQAGREVRIIVKPEKITDAQMTLMARDVAKKVEERYI